MRWAGTQREAQLSRLAQRTMTPIYTCSACASICIFKNTLPSFPVRALRAFACAPVHVQGCAHVAAMCLWVGVGWGLGAGGVMTARLCACTCVCVCVSGCVLHVQHARLSVRRPMWPYVTTQQDLLLITVLDSYSGEENVGHLVLFIYLFIYFS